MVGASAATAEIVTGTPQHTSPVEQALVWAAASLSPPRRNHSSMSGWSASLYVGFRPAFPLIGFGLVSPPQSETATEDQMAD